MSPRPSLADIAAHARARVVQAEALRPRAQLESLIASLPPTRGFAKALATKAAEGPCVAVIAETKRQSPSAGLLRQGEYDPGAIAQGYEAAGAAAISVLTDGPHFGGELGHLGLVRRAVEVPLLQKDFITGSYQILEARAFGADAVLLIAALLNEAELVELAAEARRFGLDALVEVHADEELPRALAARPALLGVNARDLSTYEMDHGRFARVVEAVAQSGQSPLLVAESGLKGGADLRRVRTEGASAALVGEALLRAPEPGAELGLWFAAALAAH